LARKEAAFARALIYPILVFVLGFVVLFLAYLLR
jgi:type II secretory pathway component PulF